MCKTFEINWLCISLILSSWLKRNKCQHVPIIKQCRCSLVASRGIAWFMTSVKHESRQCWVPQRWCTAPAWWALSPKNGSHCSSDPNGCSWCQVHLWWIRMCLQRQDSLWEWPLEVSDALSAWHATKQALLCQHYNKYVYNVYTYMQIYALCFIFYGPTLCTSINQSCCRSLEALPAWALALALVALGLAIDQRGAAEPHLVALFRCVASRSESWQLPRWPHDVCKVL